MNSWDGLVFDWNRDSFIMLELCFMKFVYPESTCKCITRLFMWKQIVEIIWSERRSDMPLLLKSTT